MKENPLISYCIFAYNHEKYIKKTLESAFAQTYSPLQILISDDGSSDNTPDIITKMIKNYSGRHEIIFNRQEQNNGLLATLNKAFYEIAQGDFLILAAGDDITTPDKTQDAYCALSSSSNIIAVSLGLSTIDENNKIIKPFNKEGKLKIYSFKDYIKSPKLHINAHRMIDRRVVSSFPPLKLDCITEDSTILFRCFLLGDVGYLPKLGTYYREHSNSMSMTVTFNYKEISDQYQRDLNYAYEKGIIDFKKYKAFCLKIEKYNNYNELLRLVKNEKVTLSTFKKLLKIQFLSKKSYKEHKIYMKLTRKLIKRFFKC